MRPEVDVAVIGAGPSGLSAAHDLALLGRDRLAARLGARPLLDEQEVAAGVVRAAPREEAGELEREKISLAQQARNRALETEAAYARAIDAEQELMRCEDLALAAAELRVQTAEEATLSARTREQMALQLQAQELLRLNAEQQLQTEVAQRLALEEAAVAALQARVASEQRAGLDRGGKGGASALQPCRRP